MTLLRRVAVITATLGVLHLQDAPARAQQPDLSLGVDAGAPLVVIRSQYRRLPFPVDIRRIAVAETSIVTAELVTNREVLLAGRQTGRTTMVIWFANGQVREFPVAVQADLTVLERALKALNPTIEVESAPDRDALVLTGTVPDLRTALDAERYTRNYLAAGGNGRVAAQPVVPAPSPDVSAAPPPGGAAANPQAQTVASPPPSATQNLAGAGAVINLIQVIALPQSPEQKILAAIRTIGGENVTIRRVLKGEVADDTADILIFEGRVPNQTALVRILTLAAQLFTGTNVTAADVRVIADEAGGLTEQMQTQASQSLLGGGATSSLFGGSRGARLTNEVRTNLGRAKAIEVAAGRILSFIEVTDLPQVRVDIRLEEVNRTKLRAWNPNSAILTSDFRQPSLNPAQSAVTVQGDQAARVGSLGAAIQNVFSFLNGVTLNQLQYSGGSLAVDAAFQLLEREGISQSLSSPSLTVLSGELAQVQVGGEIPVPTAFAPAFGTVTTPGAPGGGGATTPGVFSSVEFVPFGVQLQIRPLVGDDGTITLDVQPMVVTPDALLTDTIRQTTGTAVATTAFQTRALRTSSRLQDGQALLIGGLLSKNTSTNTASAPGIRDTPILGRLFQSFNRNDQDTELVVIVNPAVIRTPVPNVAMWGFPDRDELLRSVLSETSGTPTQ
ncbi:MAG TPA: pilus assembly protein N-terminal domain-containing protein [Vicinamibacterales bacterium]|nr:pilus assembly protein N-terminal domain-containing protein [Vicinamibacterales bacterium]